MKLAAGRPVPKAFASRTPATKSATASHQEDCARMPRRHHRGDKLKRDALRLLWKEAYHDEERAEFVSSDSYPIINIARGEVLVDSRGIVAPALKKD